MPALQTSAYLTKNSSKPSGCTIVDSLILSVLDFCDLPLVARIKTGNGEAGCRSANESLGWFVGDEGEERALLPWLTVEYGQFRTLGERWRTIQRFWVRYTEPCCEFLWESKSSDKRAKN